MSEAMFLLPLSKLDCQTRSNREVKYAYTANTTKTERNGERLEWSVCSEATYVKADRSFEPKESEWSHMSNWIWFSLSRLLYQPRCGRSSSVSSERMIASSLRTRIVHSVHFDRINTFSFVRIPISLSLTVYVCCRILNAAIVRECKCYAINAAAS